MDETEVIICLYDTVAVCFSDVMQGLLVTCYSINISDYSYYGCLCCRQNDYGCLPPQITLNLLKYMAFNHSSLSISIHIER